MDSFTVIRNIYLSRITLLDLLEVRGYETTPFRKFSPEEISVSVNNFQSLGFVISRKDGDTRLPSKCVVEYSKLTRGRLLPLLTNIRDEDVNTKEMIVMIIESIGDVHNNMAITEYNKRKMRVSFFNINALVVNPLKHTLVPKHEIITEEEKKELMENYFLTSKSKLPTIRYHTDPITRCIGAVPGDIIKITRPSPTAGEYLVYRHVAP